jgi:acyl-CoA thioesterase-1
MKRHITLIEIGALIIVVLLSATAILNGSINHYPKDKVVVAFGDSLTRGYGTPPGKNFVTYLSEYTKIPIINSGVSGDTTAKALIRLKQDVLDYEPDIVLVLLGGNDYLAGYSEEVVFVNLRTIVREIRENDAKVILIGGSKEIVPQYEKVFEKLVFDAEVDNYIPSILRGILLRKDLLYDDIHPNDRGHEVIAKRILPKLEKVLRE